jgi:GDP-L-fucose synthase
MAAAHTSGAGISSSQPWELVNANLIMNATLLQAAAEAGIRRLVLVGSATLYQLFDGYISEDQLDLNQDPPDAYMGVGWVTRYIEKLCAFWHKQSDMDIVMVRASNIFGSYAQFDPKTSNFIPALIRKAVDRMDPFEVWGNPQVTRDVIYSDDFARAVVLMLEREDIQFDVFNIATGIKTTVGEVVEWVLKSAGHVPSRISYNDQLPKTAPFRALDCSKAQTILGWKPEVSVEQGIKQTVQWWQQNRDCWNR